MSKRIAAILCVAASAMLAPRAHTLGLDMSSLWPNDDGRSWTYQQHWEEVFPNPSSGDNVVRLLFDGATVAPNGIDAQLLRGEVVSGATSTSASTADGLGPLLGNLWRARPDLRPALQRRVIEGTAGSPSCPTDAPLGLHAVLLTGDFAFRKTADEIAAWRCNLADTRSWLWLVSDLTLGNTFTLQLIPDIASGVYLHGTIAAIEDVTVPRGSFSACLRVDYVVDYGTAVCTDSSGIETGTARAETRGYVHYAPGVGPVQSFEEFIPYAAVTGTCGPPEDVGRVSSRASMQLFSGPVPVVPTTWGRIKAAYR